MATKLTTNKLSAKHIVDEPPKQNESFDDSILDESYLSLGVGDSEEGPAIRAETVHRGIDFSNNRMVLNSNLDAFMDRQLQLVAEKLADKRSLEKYNMVLRMNMKTHMENIQEMLEDSTNIQNRINKEKQARDKQVTEWEDIEFEMQETRFRIEELRQQHFKGIEDWEHLKNKLYTDLSNARDEFILKRDQDEVEIDKQKQKIDKLDQVYRKKQSYKDQLAKSYSNATKKVGISMKSLKDKNKLLDEMLKQGKVSQKVKSPKVVGNLTKILSTSEINKKFEQLCRDNNKFKLKQSYS